MVVSTNTPHIVEGCKEPLPCALNIPMLNMTMLDCMPNNAKQIITLVAYVGNSVIKKYYGNTRFGNRERYQLCAKTPTKSARYPDLRASFEYYNSVVATLHSELRRHINYERNNRNNQNRIFIYLFALGG